MYPTKSVFDYIAEMDRYPKSESLESNYFQAHTPTTRTGSFNQPSMAQSSSSTETSPDSFPDLTPHQFTSDFRPEEARKPSLYQRNANWRQEQYDNQFRSEYHDRFRPGSFDAHPFERPTVFDSHMPEIFGNQHLDMNNFKLTEHIQETPVIARHQRPIMGRKIMTTEVPLKTIDEFPIWQNTPPSQPKTLNRNTNIYELFPSENRGFDFPSPVKSPHTSPRLGASPQVPVSPRTSNASITPPPQSSFSPRMSTPFKEPLVGPSTSFTTNYGSSKMCTFCRKNGETPLVYMTHTVKEKVGNKNVVTCPILRSHICSTCGASGDNAHTITYCPVLRSGNNGQPLRSTTITLKNTRVKSNGRRRY